MIFNQVEVYFLFTKYAQFLIVVFSLHALNSAKQIHSAAFQQLLDTISTETVAKLIYKSIINSYVKYSVSTQNGHGFTRISFLSSSSMISDLFIFGEER